MRRSLGVLLGLLVSACAKQPLPAPDAAKREPPVPSAAVARQEPRSASSEGAAPREDKPADSPSVAVRGNAPVGLAVGGDVTECEQPKHDSWPFRSIDALGSAQVAAGGYRTTGWVVECYVPPPCPSGRRCNATPPPLVKLAQENDLTSPRLTLDGKCGARFQVGQRYDVAVALLSPNGSFGGVNHGAVCAVRPARPQ